MRLAAALMTLALTFSAAVADVARLETKVIDNKGGVIGTAAVAGGPNATIIRLMLQPGALSPGWHGIHLHATGDCSDHDKFLASKGHVNHGGKKHGKLNAEGPDDGDLANIFANADGSVNAEVATSTLLAKLRDADGSALVIHANADDHQSQPIGGAGARVGCAVLK